MIIIHPKLSFPVSRVSAAQGGDSHQSIYPSTSMMMMMMMMMMTMGNKVLSTTTIATTTATTATTVATAAEASADVIESYCWVVHTTIEERKSPMVERRIWAKLVSNGPSVD
jgi:hypothetical protein